MGPHFLIFAQAGRCGGVRGGGVIWSGVFVQVNPLMDEDSDGGGPEPQPEPEPELELEPEPEPEPPRARRKGK